MSSGLSDILQQAAQRQGPQMQPFSLNQRFQQAPPPVQTPFFQGGAPPLAGVLANARPDLAQNFENMGNAPPLTQPGTQRPPDFIPPGLPGGAPRLSNLAAQGNFGAPSPVSALSRRDVRGAAGIEDPSVFNQILGRIGRIPRGLL